MLWSLRGKCRFLGEDLGFIAYSGDRRCANTENLLPFSLQFSMESLTFYETISGLLGLRSWSTVQRMKNCYLEDSGCAPTLFNGSPSNYQRLSELFRIIAGSELVMAGDAISIGSHLTVQATGDVYGLMTLLTVTENRVFVWLTTNRSFALHPGAPSIDYNVYFWYLRPSCETSC
jgi:hypothetical protein